MDFELIYAKRFTSVQRYVQTTHAYFLSLIISGLEYSRVYTPTGRKYIEGSNQSLRLLPPGFKIDFSYGPDRENMVIVCNIPGLRFDENTNRLLLRYHDTEIVLKPNLALSWEQTIHLRSIFERIIYLNQSQLPSNVFAAEELSCSVLSELAVNDSGTQSDIRTVPDLADRLKQLLDEDLGMRLTLGEHCRDLGYCPEYARRCFRRKFFIDPKEYRQKRRLEYIIQLMNQHCYTAKEIADLAGMKTVNHLHSFIRQRCGMTPRELAGKFPG